LPESVRSALCLAALRHDDGKRDMRFHGFLRMLPAIVAAGLPSVAKGVPELGVQTKARAAHAASGLPSGFRHERRSLEVLEATWQDEWRVDRDLVRMLVASHHGHAMPFFPAVDDPSPPDILLEDGARVRPNPAVGTIAAEAFARCVERYGWFGTAYLNAVLRLADHLRSANEAAAIKNTTEHAHV